MKEHPLERFGYCPVCGSSRFSVNNVKSKRCGSCGFVYYANPSSATAAFIVRDEHLLVVRRGKEPARGTLDLPGGFVDMDETAEEGMARELFGTRVKLDGDTESGRITLYYYNGDDLQRIWDVLEMAKDGR